jgi:hypothetical protein
MPSSGSLAMTQLRRQLLREEIKKGVLFRSDLNQDQVIVAAVDIAANCLKVTISIARSAVSSSPFLRGPSPNCDRTKNQTNTPAGDHSQVCCSRYAESLVTVRVSRVARSS